MQVFDVLRASIGFLSYLTDSIRRPTTLGIKIKNFGQMDERFYRGGQPRKNQYRDLAAMGITTVIDLREDPKTYAWPSVEATGMRYVNIRMSDTKYPDSELIDTFLRIVTEPGLGKFFVHCAGGRHRAGVMGAVYRLTINHWNYDQVYSEMRSYDFYARWGHAPLKNFVRDYSRGLEDQQSGPGNSDKVRMV